MIHYLALKAGSVAKVGDNLAASLVSDLVKTTGNSKMDLSFLIAIFICKCHRQVAEQTLPIDPILAFSAKSLKLKKIFLFCLSPPPHLL